MKLLREYIRGILIEQPTADVWYHGSGKGISGALRPFYLTDDEAIAGMLGSQLYKFQINPAANWLDLSDIQMGPLAMVSMDSVGGNQKQIAQIREKGYDIVWQKDEFPLYRQIFVINPHVVKISP